MGAEVEGSVGALWRESGSVEFEAVAGGTDELLRRAGFVCGYVKFWAMIAARGFGLCATGRAGDGAGCMGF